MSGPRRIRRDRLTAAGLFLEAHDGLMDHISSVHRQHGLDNRDFDAMLRIARSTDRCLRMSDLATQTGTSTSGITRVVDRLESNDHVERSLAPDDRRSWLVALTEAGATALADDIADLVLIIDEVLLDPLGDSASAFFDKVRMIRDHVRPQATVVTSND